MDIILTNPGRSAQPQPGFYQLQDLVIAVSNIHIEPDWSEVKPTGFYVYIHRRLTDGLVMHVGKGKGRSAWSRSGRNQYWRNTGAKHGVLVEIFKDGLSEQCALTLEKIAIFHYRALGHPLTNMTNGGEGTSGYNRPRSDAEREKLRAAKGVSGLCCSNGMRFKTSKDAAAWVSEIRGVKSFSSAINLACTSRTGMAYWYSWWREGCQPRPVVDGRVEHGKKNKIPVICSDGTRHESARDAEKYMKSLGFCKASSSAISVACRKRIGSAYGRSWWYEGDEPVLYIPRYVRSARSNKKLLT